MEAKSNSAPAILFSKLPGLNDRDREYIRGRGASDAVLDNGHVFSAKPRFFPQLQRISTAIGFAFSSVGAQQGWRVVNGVKLRAVPNKAFSFWGGTDQFYRPTLGASAGNNASFVVTEGEIDSLVAASARPDLECGSLPHGAGTIDFVSKPSVADLLLGRSLILAGDADEPGIAAMRKLALRCSGVREIRRVVWPNGLKDASEVAMAMGLTAVGDAIENAGPFSIDDIEGMASAASYAKKLTSLYDGELAAGYKIGISDLDRLYSVPMGYMTVITGWPNEGKSQFVANMLVALADKHGLKAALWAPEEGPESYISKLIEIKEGRPFFQHDVVKRLDHDGVSTGLAWVDKHFTFLTQADGQDASIKSIIERLDVAVRVRGCRLIVIDPYNYIDKPNGSEQEVEWIRKLLISLKRWTQTRQCHLFLVAHPRQLPNGQQRFVPTGFHISGGAPWNAITDFGMTVYRCSPGDNSSAFSEVEIHLWKVRQKWHGQRGVALLDYERSTGRYLETMSGRPEGMGVDWEALAALEEQQQEDNLNVS